ncbi:hypothetical protein BOX08_gp21 [Pseudoalteromonas phage BS5]|uniref:hypothetical protein n=1 Tax=Pseudoalteromonas phage BS5 TaxID=1874539 RepID=UPI000819A0FE|nr:hypothetical protein BOX08_gp21 [Pseudoalteromonas phage BS5]ANY29586.1 hypothetical protein [Pseudoalteromonas phage BS5]
MILSDYQEDEKRQNQGVKVKIDDAVFIIKRFGTRESDIFMANLRKKKYNPYAVISDGEKQHLENEVFGEWLAKYAIVDWYGVYDDNEELPYSKAAAWDIFTNPEYFLSLNNALISRAVDIKNFLHINADEDIEAIKPRLKFDADHPTAEEKQTYLKHCDALGADAGLTDLNELQAELLNALYRADRNRDKDCSLKDKQILEQVKGVALDEDIALSIIQHLDSYLLTCRNDKIKRESKK